MKKTTTRLAVRSGLLGLTCTLLLAACGSTTTVLQATPAKQVVPPIDYSKYTLAVQEDFNNTAGSPYFSPYYMPYWNVDRERSRSNITISGGVATLRTTPDMPLWNPLDGDLINSSFMSAVRDGLHDSWSNSVSHEHHEKPFLGIVGKYGVYEVRMKFTDLRTIGTAVGHAAWWMVGMQDRNWQNGELDLVETYAGSLNDPYTHVLPWSDPTLNFFSNNNYNAGVPVGADWHTYTVEWTPQSLKGYFDGQPWFTTNQAPSYRMMTFLGLYTHKNKMPASGWENNLNIDYFKYYTLNGYPTAPNEPLDGENLGAYAITGADTSEAGGAGKKITALSDNDFTNSYASKPGVGFPQYLYFDWTTPRSFDTVDLTTHFAQGQGPTSWNIEVSSDGTNYTQVASSGVVNWLYNDSTKETQKVTFPQVSNIKSMRIKVNSSNLAWNKTAIVDVDVYNQSARSALSIVRFKNRWQPNQYLVEANNRLKYAALNTSDLRNQWIRTTVNGYTQYRNRASGKTLNNQNNFNFVEVNDVNSGWWSKDWTASPVTGTSFVRLLNRNTGCAINVESQNGFGQCTSIADTAWSSQWTVETVQ